MSSTASQPAAPVAAPPPAAPSAHLGPDAGARALLDRALLDRAIDALIALALHRIVRMLEQFAQLMQAWRDGTLPPLPPARLRATGPSRGRAPAPASSALPAWPIARMAVAAPCLAPWASPAPSPAPCRAPAPPTAPSAARLAGAPTPAPVPSTCPVRRRPPTHAQRPRPPPTRISSRSGRHSHLPKMIRYQNNTIAPVHQSAAIARAVRPSRPT